jgi:hypothetical protein
VSRPEADLAVVHLVWGPLGPVPLREFMASYRKHPAGVDHELVVLFNGVTDEQRPVLLAELEGVEHRLLTLSAPVQDLAAYFQAAERLEHERVCFLNSYSVLAADCWLELLSGALSEPGIGLAGASGSWASVASRVHWELWRRGAYAGIFDDEQAFPERLLDTFAEFDRPAGRPWRMHKFWTLVRILTSYHRFPAHHLRTNGFAIERETMFCLHAPRSRDKIDAHLLECGRRSITRQIERMHMHVVIAGRDGNYHRPADWARSRTFWQGDQENLLIADNQTENYQRGAPDVRLALSRWAWGAEADSRAAGD